MRHLFSVILFSLASAGFLECDWDADWSSFRERLGQNADAGYPEDAMLAEQARSLLEVHWEALQPNAEALYGMSYEMQSFFASCNTRPGAVEELREPFCLYGVVSALWVSARHGHPERKQLLRHAQFLLGDLFRSTLDFMEGSGWALTSLDILANLEQKQFPCRSTCIASIRFRGRFLEIFRESLSSRSGRWGFMPLCLRSRCKCGREF